MMRIVLGTLLALVSSHALAIVNMAELHTKEYEEGFLGQLDLAVEGASGNSDYREYSVGGLSEWSHDNTVDYLRASLRYGKAGDSVTSDEAFLHARHIQPFAPQFDWEAFAQYSYNKLARLKRRELLGGGLRQQLLKSDKSAVLLGYGAFVEREVLDDSQTDGGSDSALRGNAYLILTHQLSANTRINSTTYYQPDLGSFDDYRLIETASLVVDINESLSLKLAIDYTHDNEPPLGVEKGDFHYLTGLSYRF